MGINNLNPRRVVWFSTNEPSNKYDIWLSRNAHLDENGEPTTDSNSQRDCDYIFKIYDCGKWNPILGFNSTAANKIDCVENNTLYHPAIFTGQNPNDISDNGSLGELLADSHYVNEQEWEDIFNTEQFQQAFNTQVIDGDNYNWESLIETTVQELLDDGEITIPASQFEWRRATTSLLGGIKASAFRSIIPQEEIAEACFNDNLVDQTQNNDRLYIWAKDMMQAIQAYTEDHSDDSDFPYIVPPYVIPEQDVPNLLWDWFENSSTVLKGWQQSTGQAVANKPRFVIAGSRTAANRGKLLKLRDPDDPFWQTSEYTELNNAIEWVDPSELSTYTLEVASTSALGGIKAATHASAMLPESQVAECKFYNPSLLHQDSYKKQALCIDIKDVKNALDAWYASEDSDEWDVNLKASYGIVVRKETFTDDDDNQIVSYTHSLSNYGQFTKERMYCRTKFYNQSTPGVQNRDYSYNDTHGLEWVSGLDIITDALNVTESTNGFLKCTDGYFSFDQAAGGESYPTLSSDSQSNVDYVVKGGGTAGTYLDHNGQWTTPPNTQYQVFSTSVNGLVPKPNSASSKLFLNSAGGWSAPQLSVDTFNGLNSGLVPQPATSSAKYFLDATGNWSTPGTGGGGSGSNFSITMAQSIQASGNYTISNQTIDNTQSGFNRILIDEWSYYNLDAGDSQDVSITFSNTHVSGNAIYIRVNTGGYQVSIDVGSTDIIDSNGVFGASKNTLSSNSSYLFTIQFGIIKVEIISASKSSGGSEEQLSGNGGN